MDYILYTLLAGAGGVYLHGVNLYIKSDRRRGAIPALVGVVALFILAAIAFEFVVAAMILLFVAIPALVLIAKKTKVVWARPAAGALAIVGVVISISNLVVKASRPVHADIGPTTLDRKLEVQAMGEVLGAKVERVARTDILVLVDSTTDKQYVTDFAAGLTTGLNSTITSVIVEEVRTAPTDPMNRFNDVTKAAIEKIAVPLALHPQCRLVVSMVPIPSGFFTQYLERLEDSDDPKRELDSIPKFVLLNYSVPDLETLMSNGIVLSLVVNNPEIAVYDPKRTGKGDSNEIFNEKFLMVNGDNVTSVMLEYPHLF